MKKLFIKLAILVSLVFTFNYIYIEYFPYYYMDSMYIFYKVKKDLSYQIAPSLRTIIIGDSYPTTGILSAKIDNSYNFGLPGGSAIESYYLLKRILSTDNNIKTVFLTLAPHHLEGYSCEFWTDPVMYSFYDNKELLEIINFSDSLQDYTAVGEHPYISLLMHNFHIETNLQPKILKSYFFLNKSSNMKMSARLAKNLGHSFLGTDSCNANTVSYNPDKFIPKPLYDFYFYKILGLCKEKNVRLIFETMPIKKPQLKITKASYLEQYKAYIRVARTKFPEHKITDSLMIYEPCLYGDRLHLNSRGANIYTEGLLTRYFNNINPQQTKETLYPYQ